MNVCEFLFYIVFPLLLPRLAFLGLFCAISFLPLFIASALLCIYFRILYCLLIVMPKRWANHIAYIIIHACMLLHISSVPMPMPLLLPVCTSVPIQMNMFELTIWLITITNLEHSKDVHFYYFGPKSVFYPHTYISVRTTFEFLIQLVMMNTRHK